MTSHSSYNVYAFDAYGTLFDVHAAAAELRERIGPQAQRLSEIWRTKQLEYTWVRTLSGAYLDFMTVTEHALDFAASQCGGISPDTRADLLESYRSLAAYPDVKPVLQALRDGGARTVILSNGTPSMLEDACHAAGIEHLVDRVISVDSIRRYKTLAGVYALVGEWTGAAASDISFQSSNRWDIAGAASFGFRTVWVNRTGQPDEYHDLAADHIISTLSQLPSLTKLPA